MQDKHQIIGKIMASYPVMGNLTEEEQQFFNEWILKESNRQFFDAAVDNASRLADLKQFLEIDEIHQANRHKYFAAIKTLYEKPKLIWWKRWPTYVAAASVLIMVSLIGYKMFNGKQRVTEAENPKMVQIKDIGPGQYKARLTLDDGTVIVLDSASNGKMVQQGGTNVFNKDGQLIYQPKEKTNEVLYNTLSTAKGETYPVKLSDGTMVWLNAESSIRYPVSFNGDIRKVQVTGEAYFEVKPSLALLADGHTGKRPFVVDAPGMEVVVLGTHFNINSYSDESAVKTTLLEGKVKVLSKSGSAVAILEPGQQAKLERSSQELEKIDDVDVDAEVAWHYGYFQFQREDLKAVLRQLARWYDVDVVYQGNLPDEKFGGKISRSNSLLQVLGTLHSNGVHFRLEGKKIFVSNLGN